ncbi:Maintenance of telomere capping protein 6 [Scheffersomyces spartinae]|uniref:Maintenance of telomere capping protein 6 n=1 Tax=Scheffersomyces spartinae TaxID=45513 RepID=A0A9P7VCV4_9ASCO|nr:Maintenance of telomere capping protein 6 [Scheffersomyces spartinae]KAG7195778.1 Maintenance of telomere capping protein 6 [Scheffersomyces spartinae]
MTPWILLFLLVPAYTLENWPSLSSILTVVQRSHRDVSKDVPNDQIGTFGVSLGTQLFARKDYSPDALVDFRNLLNVGTQTLMVDLYWNGATQIWQLCPAPYPANTTYTDDTIRLEWKGKTYNCDPSLTMALMVKSMVSYFGDTNNVLLVNIINLIINLKEIDFSTSNNGTVASKGDLSKYIPQTGSINTYGNSTLVDTFAEFGTLAFTPLDQDIFNGLRDDSFYNISGTSTPSVYYLAWLDLNRVAVRIAGNEVKDNWYSYNITETDKSVIFFPENPNAMMVASVTNETVLNECTTLLNNMGNIQTSQLVDMATKQHFKFILDDDTDSFNNDSYTRFISCGYSPILNAKEYSISNFTTGEDVRSQDLGAIINNFLARTFLLTELTDVDDEESMKAATRCVVFVSDLLSKVANCYNQYPYACQNISNPVDWFIGDDEREYFDAYSDACPEGYQFSVPHLLVELISMRNEIHKKNISYPVWVDINDITVNLCFVSGGPYANCPYQETVSKQKLVGLIAPSFVVGAVILVLMFLERFFRTNPIQTRRKTYWRRRVLEFNKLHEYEGVPS